MKWTTPILLLLTVLSACGRFRTEAVPKSDRILSIDLNQSEEGGFDRALLKAKEAGSQTVSMSLQWDEVETSPGSFEPEVNWLAIANSYYPKAEMQVSLVINPIDTGRLRLPSDLEGRSFKDPQVIERFKNLLDWIFEQIPVAHYQQYYGVKDQKFGEYLRSVGLRTYPGLGQDKESYRVLREEAMRRGW